MPTSYTPADSVEDILITPELYTRKSRHTDAIAEADEYYRIAETLAESPKAALQELVSAGVDLCSAGSCGLSVLERAVDQPIFRWTYMAGVYAGYIGGTTPRD